MTGWLLQNKEWFLSGIGVAIITAIIRWLFKRKKSNSAIKQKLQSGDYSTSSQAGRDVINISIAETKANRENVTRMISKAIDINTERVNALKEQYDKIINPSINYMPNYFLDLHYLQNVIEHKMEILESLPSWEIIYDAISNLFVLEKTLETLRTTGEKELVKLRDHRIYQQDIITRCKEQLNITKISLAQAKEVFSKILLP